MCVAPLLVSKVSSEIASEHGAGLGKVRVTLRSARNSPRAPVAPELAKGKLIDEVTPEAMVKFVAAPTAVPAALIHVTEPVHDAAVPDEAFAATFVKLTRAVSVLPIPNGPRF